MADEEKEKKPSTEEKEKKPSTFEKMGSGLGKAFSSAGPVVAVVALGGLGIYLVYQWVVQGFFGAGQKYTELYQNQLSAYVAKMKQYSIDSHGNLTSGQLASENTEQQAMLQTQILIGQSYNSFDAFIKEALDAALVIVGLTAAPWIISKWKKLLTKNPPRTSMGWGEEMDMYVADVLLSEGDVVGATNFVNSLTSYYNNVQSVNMQNMVQSYQQQISEGVITGFELTTAYYMVDALQYDMALMAQTLQIPLGPV